MLKYKDDGKRKNPHIHCVLKSTVNFPLHLYEKNEITKELSGDFIVDINNTFWWKYHFVILSLEDKGPMLTRFATMTLSVHLIQENP